MSFTVAALAGFVALAGSVNAHSASPIAVLTVQEQFANSFIVPDVLPAFKPVALASLQFPDFDNVTTVGLVLTKEQASQKPIPFIKGTEELENVAGGPLNVTTAKFTILTFDAGVAGSNSTEGYNLHWLVNDWVYGTNNDHTVTLVGANEGETAPPAVVPYAGPAPSEGSGAHRYVTLIYAQPDNFTQPAVPAVGSGVAKFDIVEYRAASGLGAALAGTYFTVEVGTATEPAVSTAAVDVTTLSGYVAPTDDAHDDTADASSSASDAAETAAPASGAGKVVAGGFVASAIAVVAALL